MRGYAGKGQMMTQTSQVLIYTYTCIHTGDKFSGDFLRTANMLGERDFPRYTVRVGTCLYGCLNKFTLTRFQGCHNRSGTDTGEHDKYPSVFVNLPTPLGIPALENRTIFLKINC